MTIDGDDNGPSPCLGLDEVNGHGPLCLEHCLAAL
jgi:hypothetical protein